MPGRLNAAESSRLIWVEFIRQVSVNRLQVFLIERSVVHIGGGGVLAGLKTVLLRLCIMTDEETPGSLIILFASIANTHSGKSVTIRVLVTGWCVLNDKGTVLAERC